MSAVQKMCCGCSADVAEQIRVKDQEGRYFCQPCFETKTRSKMPEVAIAASPPMARKAPQQVPVPAASDDTYDIAFVEEVKAAPPPKSKEEVFGCADCKKLVTQRQIRNDDGDFVCIPCFTRRRKNAPAAGQTSAPVRRKSFAEEDGVSDVLPFHYTILGGLLISVGIIVFGWFVFLAIELFAPRVQRSLPVGIIISAVTATFESFYVMVSAGALIFSLTVVSKILGGCDLGSFGNALWKSLLASTLYTLLLFLLDRTGLFFMFRFCFLGLFLYVMYIMLFKLDSFEASLLTVINYGISWALAIVLAIILIKVAAVLRPRSAAVPLPNVENVRLALIPSQSHDLMAAVFRINPPLRRS